ncbi:MAG: hypothetical protein M0R03_15215 [Novosphingobium sp.]|nr:hypothetical protein [Novosphingobium sp.]
MENLKEILKNGSDMRSVYSREVEEESKKAVKAKLSFIPYDERNFLSVKLRKEDHSLRKTVKCRILDCFDLDDKTCVDVKGNPIPFKEVYSHIIRNKEGKYKTYTCLKHTKGIEHLGLGNKCPICELEEFKLLEAKEEKNKEKSREMWIAAKAYSAKKQYLVRVIDRANESHGVKFWRFDASNNKQGVYDKLNDLYEQRINGGSIYNTYSGKDIFINIVGKETKYGNNNIFKSSITSITDEELRTPLSDNEEQIMSWITDAKKWYLLFPPKPFEYLDVAMYGDTPKIVSVNIETDGVTKEYKVWSSKNDFDIIRMRGGEPVFDYKIVKYNENNEPVIEGEWVDSTTNNDKTEDELYIDNNSLTDSIIDDITKTEELPF